jgi:hypothetical protein
MALPSSELLQKYLDTDAPRPGVGLFCSSGRNWLYRVVDGLWRTSNIYGWSHVCARPVGCNAFRNPSETVRRGCRMRMAAMEKSAHSVLSRMPAEFVPLDNSPNLPSKIKDGK